MELRIIIIIIIIFIEGAQLAKAVFSGALMHGWIIIQEWIIIHFWETAHLPLPYKPTFLTTSNALRRVSGPAYIVSNKSFPLRKPNCVQPAVGVVAQGGDARQ